MKPPHSRTERILPVIDIQHGVVVRGVAGDRERYRPIQSRLTGHCDCATIGLALRDSFGFDRLYVADLDAIGGAPVNATEVGQLLDLGFHLTLDAGIGDVGGQQRLARQLLGETESANIDWVVGLESLREAGQLAALAALLGERCILSIDLKGGQLMTPIAAWQGRTADWIADRAVDCGLQRMIVLDLAAVGVDAGPLTVKPCERIRANHGDIELISGGGVRNLDDVQCLIRAGCDHVLVASALHNGAIEPSCQ
jgi:phosphoribosylformimino-5-aminoimidazole carboxamide ribotide isomerase